VKLVTACDLFVTNDTGTMHVAAAAGVPVLAIFGSTDERATAPLGPRVRLLKKPAPCSPCLLRHCPVDHRCMRDISVSEVFETACQILSAARPSSSTVTAR
jgi:heptosyltransferase-2